MLLRKVQATLQVGSDRHTHPGPTVLYYQLFSIYKERGLVTVTEKGIKKYRENSAAVGSSVGTRYSGSNAL